MSRSTPPSARARPSRARAGFTLVELLGVLVILGLLGTMSIMTWQSVQPQAQLNSAVRALASTLSEARSDAIARNEEFLIEYYFEETPEHPRGYRVITPFRADGTGGLAAFDEERLAKTWMVLPETVWFASITVDGVVYTEGQVTVRFDPLGAASDHLIVLEQRPYENFYTIEVLALTGLIRFHDGRFEREYPDDGDFQ